MLELTENLGPVPAPAGSAGLTLDFDQRSRTRLRAVLDDGREAAVMLPHGRGMREGDVLRSKEGATAVVRCKTEKVITVRVPDWPSLARAAYHFGNRHAELQLGDLFLRFRPDPALEKMAASLGLAARAEETAFIPEPGPGQHFRGCHGHGN
ncbi:MAG: urease accessory protein UreE [Planctomycetota bacterium]|jgi:urease accessory protein|nr:urease accessory protein UreE [Planctomycetota bacterium]